MILIEFFKKDELILNKCLNLIKINRKMLYLKRNKYSLPIRK